MIDYLALESEPAYRPKVYKIQIKKYGLRKVVRVATKNNGDVHRHAKKQKTVQRAALRHA